ncbi:hypothetical protein DVH24_034951 [Malus domestica]|uniref:Uncharacterized protein n=1 Tax=Malus domestica TaxID=3750 RepID=A0A498IEB0_MALDO|nr:hypothetical protein DVH24_034951 [Malus domestica]
MLGDIEIKDPLVSDPCPMEETTPDDAEISQEFVPTQVHTPHIPYQDAEKQSTKLQVCFEIDGLDGNVHTNSESGKSHGQLLDTTLLHIGQATDLNVFAVGTDNTASQPIKLKEIHEFCKQATFYNGKKKKVRSSLILRQEIRPMQKLWVLNTRFKLV